MQTNETYESIETDCPMRHILGDTVCGTQDSFKNHLKQRMQIDFPLRKSFQDPTKICYTPDILPDVHKKSDHITLDLRKFIDKIGRYQERDGALPSISLHIHMQGQFMRSIGKELSGLSAGDLIRHCPEELGVWGCQCFGSRLTYDISQVTLLKSRHDAEDRCDTELKDEDSMIMETILNDEWVGCVPTYWMGLKNYSSEYPKCTTVAQHQRIAYLTSNFTSLERVRKLFVSPCEEMIIVTNVQQVKGRLSKDPGNLDPPSKDIYLDIQFRHVNNRYQVITNTRGFSVESCWSGIGGFIGIFVGVSLMQLPEIFMTSFNFLCKRNKEKEMTNSKFKA